jgi:hypothetical protein
MSAWIVAVVVFGLFLWLIRRWAREYDAARGAARALRPVRPRNKPIEPHYIDLHQTLLDTDPVYVEIDQARQRATGRDGWWYPNDIWYDARTQTFSNKQVSS